MSESLWLFAAGLAGGAINTLAGGGSFVTFPALLAAGVPPVSANATNTFASLPGYLSGAWGLRRSIPRDGLGVMLAVCVLGGGIGGWVLLSVSDAAFRGAVPWLLLFATALFALGAPLNGWLRRQATARGLGNRTGQAARLSALLGVAIYGGFFNAGLGILTLSVLALSGQTGIHAMNGLKLLISCAVSLMAVAVFVAQDLIAWQAGIAVLLGSLLGGYAAARVSQRLNPALIRYGVIAAGLALTLHYL